MRHHNANRKFGRESTQRRALLRTLTVSLISREKIKTTEAKAKELAPFAEKLVTKAKSGTVASRRDVTSVLGTTSGVKKLFDTIAPKYKDRHGGYTRIVKTERRNNDAAKMAYVEFV